MEKLLVTGAGGFIGEPTVRQLLKSGQFEIHTTHTSERTFIDGCVCHVCNLLDGEGEKLLEEIRPSHLLHLAWELPAGFENHRSNIKWLNASLSLMSKFTDIGGKRFVFAGSSSEYNRLGIRSSEDIRAKQDTPDSLYGICKRTMTDTGVLLSNSESFSFCSARIFPVYGFERGIFQNTPPRIRGSIIYAIHEIINNRKAVCMSPDTIWDFIYIDDVADCLKAITCSDIDGVVNVCYGHPHRMRDVFNKIADMLGSPRLVEMRDNPNFRYLVGDNSRMKKELGINPVVDLNSGLAILIQEYRTKLSVSQGGGN